jgi:hypothetical protein
MLCYDMYVCRSVDGAAPSEAIDFMRQSGLANRISTKGFSLDYIYIYIYIIF